MLAAVRAFAPGAADERAMVVRSETPMAARRYAYCILLNMLTNVRWFIRIFTMSP